MPPSRPARAHPSTDGLGVAWAAQDTCGGTLSPGEQVTDVGVKVASPRIVSQSNDFERCHFVQDSKRHCREAVSMQVEVS